MTNLVLFLAFLTAAEKDITVKKTITVDKPIISIATESVIDLFKWAKNNARYGSKQQPTFDISSFGNSLASIIDIRYVKWPKDLLAWFYSTGVSDDFRALYSICLPNGAVADVFVNKSNDFASRRITITNPVNGYIKAVTERGVTVYVNRITLCYAIRQSPCTIYDYYRYFFHDHKISSTIYMSVNAEVSVRSASCLRQFIASRFVVRGEVEKTIKQALSKINFADHNTIQKIAEKGFKF